MNVAVIPRKENTISIRSDVLYGESLWFRVIYYQYFRRKMFYSSVSWKSISPLKTNTQGPDRSERNSKLFSGVIVQFFIRISSVWTCQLLCPLVSPGCYQALFTYLLMYVYMYLFYFYFSHSSKCVVVSHHSLKLYFCNSLWWWGPFHELVFHSYSLFI